MRYVRAAALCGVLGVSIIAAGCGGHGGGATPPLPAADQAAPGSTMGTMSTTSATPAPGSYNLHVHGQIVAIKSATEFQINGGSGVGYLNVYTTSSTVDYYNGLAPKVGYYADVYGNGSVATYVTATQVTLSTSSTFTTTATTTTSLATPAPGSYTIHVHGPIVAIKSSTEFQINGGSGVGYLNVYTTSTTVKNGLTPAVGDYVDVYGTGSTSTYATATWTNVTSTSSSSTPTPTPTATVAPSTSVPAHVMTAAIVWAYGGVPTSVSLSSVKPYVSWVQTSPSYAAQMRSNGIKVDIYENFWRNYSSDNPSVGYTDLKPGGAHAPAEAKTCTGTVIYDSTYGGGYEADARSSYGAGHAQAFNNYRLSEYGSNYDAVFSDDTGAMGGLPLPCNWSLSSYQSATNSVHASLKVPVFVNTLGAGGNPQNQVGYVTGASNVIGGMCELCLAAHNSSGSDIVQTGTYWQEIENAAITLVADHKIFWDYARATGNPSSETALRTYIYASFLLSYSPSYSMLQEAFQSSYGFPVMPETGFVAMSPTTTATSVSGYATSTGAYMRQFGACYYRGSYKGKCAVVVNPTGSSVSVPTTAYSHSLGLVGGGVLDGGYATFGNGRPSSLAPGQATILLP